jgi:hypothetical protein
MAQRRQRGWLKKENRTQGETWVLHFRTTRKSDGKRVENKRQALPSGTQANIGMYTADGTGRFSSTLEIATYLLNSFHQTT